VYFVLLHIALLLALIAFEISRRRAVERASLQIQNNAAEALMQSIEDRQMSEEAVRTLRHDLKNHAVSMQLLLDNGEIEQAKDVGLPDAQLDDIPEYAEQKDHGVGGAKYYCHSGENGGKIGASGGYEPVVDTAERPHEERQKRVTIDVVGRKPFRDNLIGQRVEARNMEMPYKETVVVIAWHAEHIPVPAYRNSIKQGECQ
jgi:hypothetical protein